MSSWIGRMSTVVALVLGTFGVASAQATGSITGSVVDAGTGQPRGGVQIYIPATGQGALSNPAGRYLLLNVPAGEHTVRAQNLGYASAEQVVTVTAGASVTADFRLQQEAIAVEGIVVTALGIERSERSLGYAVQNLDAGQLAAAPQIDIASTLQGKVAGLQVTTASSRPGAGSRIVIRGESSFTGGGQPLWVVDGVPISMETDEQDGFELEVGQAGSRSMDVDMNNVEEISVLRGAAATALYGSRAAHGAIIVTTKSGAPGAPTRFTVSSRYGLQTPIIAGKQTTYTAGSDGYYCNGLPVSNGGWCESGYPAQNPTTTRNWGPHKDSVSAEVLAHEGSLRLADPRSDFYRTGQLSETSINATGGIGGGGSFNLGGTYANHAGIQPNTELERLNLNANVTLPLTDRLRSTTTVLYSTTKNVWQNEGWLGIEQNLMYRAPNLDVRKAWNDDGTPVMWGSNSPHPEWIAQNEYRSGDTERWIASQYFRFNILDNLSISNRVGLDTYIDSRLATQNERPWRTAMDPPRPSGYTRQDRITRTGLSNDLILTLAGTPVTNDVTVSGLAGFNIVAHEDAGLAGWGNELIIPGYYNLENFYDQNVDGDLTRRDRQMGLYAEATLDYKDWAFLSVTGRNDWSSTLPLENNSYFYPSVSLGVVFTDALGWRNRWLDYGKVRVSMANVGSDAPRYRLSTRYSDAGNVDWPFRGTLGFLQSNSLGNPKLKPESTTEYEVGMELRMLQGRARLDASYYDKRSYDQIFDVPSSAATGYSSITRNAGDLRNEGLEVTLHTVPVQTQDLRWDVRVNWSKNRSSVVALAPGVTSIPLAGYAFPQIRIMAGVPYGVIWGTGFERNEEGQVLIGDDGLPLWDDEQKVIGDTQPDWLGNLYSSFNAGPLTLSALLSTVQGGDILNFDLNYTVSTGIAKITELRGTEYVYEGVNVNTGEPNTKVITRDQEYWEDEYGFYGHHEYQIEDGTHVRLQEVSLQYEVPQTLLDGIGVRGASLFLTGHNLKIWSDFSYVDPAGSNYGATNAGGAAYRFFLPPSLRSYSLGVRANF